MWEIGNSDTCSTEEWASAFSTTVAQRIMVGRILKNVGNLSEKSDISAKQAENDIDEALSNEADIDATWRIVRCPYCRRNHIIAKE